MKQDLDWIQTIESEKAGIRELDIYPKLVTWSQGLKNVLEIGCGQGVCSTKISGNYTGIDSSSVLIERAKELYPERTFQVGDASVLPYADKSFDGVFSIAVWHLLPDIRQASQELCRVLSSNGKFLIITADPANYDAWKKSYHSIEMSGKKMTGIRKAYDGTDVQDVLYLHSKNEIFSAMNEAGIFINKMETFRNFMSLEGQLND